MIKKEEGGDWIKQEEGTSKQIIVEGMEGDEIILLPSASNDYITSNRYLRVIPQGTVDNNLGPDCLTGPKALDPNYCRQPTL